MITIGNSSIKAIFVENRRVSSIWLGNTKIYDRYEYSVDDGTVTLYDAVYSFDEGVITIQ